MSDEYNPNGPEALETRAMTLALTGAYQSWVQVASEMEWEGFKNAIKRVRDDDDLSGKVNRLCDQARTRPE